MEIKLWGKEAPVTTQDGSRVIVREAFLTAQKSGGMLGSNLEIRIRLDKNEISVDAEELKAAIKAFEEAT